MPQPDVSRTPTQRVFISGPAVPVRPQCNRITSPPAHATASAVRIARRVAKTLFKHVRKANKKIKKINLKTCILNTTYKNECLPVIHVLGNDSWTDFIRVFSNGYGVSRESFTRVLLKTKSFHLNFLDFFTFTHSGLVYCRIVYSSSPKTTLLIGHLTINERMTKRSIKNKLTSMSKIIFCRRLNV